VRHEEGVAGVYTILSPQGEIADLLLCTAFVSPATQHVWVCPGIHSAMPPLSPLPLAQGHAEGLLLSPVITKEGKHNEVCDYNMHKTVQSFCVNACEKC
jgi:hypothetical protein